MGHREPSKDHLDNVFRIKRHFVAVAEVERLALDGPDGPFIASANAFDLFGAEGEHPIVFQPSAQGREDFEGRVVEDDPYAIFVHIRQAAADHPNAFARTQPYLLQEFEKNAYSFPRADRTMSEVIFGIGL